MITNARAAYMNASIATASPQTLLVMLCDRLVLDVQRAVAAQEARQHPETHTQLLHAQSIVLELRHSLDPDGFRGGHELAALYDYLHRQLVSANVTKDVEITRHCLDLCTQIADTWREAALAAAVSAPLAAKSA